MPRVLLAKIKSGPSPDFYTWTAVAVLRKEIDGWLASLCLLSGVKIKKVKKKKKNVTHRSFSRPKTSDDKPALPNFSHFAFMRVIN